MPCSRAVLTNTGLLRKTAYMGFLSKLLTMGEGKQLKRYQAERARLKLEKEQGLLMPRAEHERDLGARALFFRNEVRNFIHLHGATLIHLVGGDEGRLRELVQWWMETTEIWMDAWSGEREFVVNEEDDGADADAPGEEDA